MTGYKGTLIWAALVVSIVLSFFAMHEFDLIKKTTPTKLGEVQTINELYSEIEGVYYAKAESGYVVKSRSKLEVGMKVQRYCKVECYMWVPLDSNGDLVL